MHVPEPSAWVPGGHVGSHVSLLLAAQPPLQLTAGAAGAWPAQVPPPEGGGGLHSCAAAAVVVDVEDGDGVADSLAEDVADDVPVVVVDADPDALGEGESSAADAVPDALDDAVALEDGDGVVLGGGPHSAAPAALTVPSGHALQGCDDQLDTADALKVPALHGAHRRLLLASQPSTCWPAAHEIGEAEQAGSRSSLSGRRLFCK